MVYGSVNSLIKGSFLIVLYTLSEYKSRRWKDKRVCSAIQEEGEPMSRLWLHRRFYQFTFILLAAGCSLSYNEIARLRVSIIIHFLTVKV